MALVSMLSVQITNPGRRIVVLCDSESARAIRDKGHPLLKVCNELISVETPGGEPVFRNRWIKTQLCRFIKGDVLFLDGDTLVRRCLDDLPSLVSELGGVANHNGKDIAEQVWDADRIIFEDMAWPSNHVCYINGGVWFYRDCEQVHRFFDQWHSYWIDGIEANGRMRDQPSLNSAIVKSGLCLSVLSNSYNAQLLFYKGSVADAFIWHFYSTHNQKQTSFHRIVDGVSSKNLIRLRHHTKNAIKATWPWPNTDWVARRISCRVKTRGYATKSESLWLDCYRWRVLVFFVRRLQKRLLSSFRKKLK